MTSSDQLALFESLLLQQQDECIIWPLTTAGQMGYGSLRVGGVKTYTHRLAYERTYGPIARGQHVLHHCDNPPCFNPRHLFSGTEKDNRADQKAKGRTSLGTKNGQARLSEAQVVQIRKLYQHGVRGRGQIALAYQFGVTRIAIRKIVKRITWSHI